MQSKTITTNIGQWVATRRFPAAAKLIEEALRSSESFRGLCNDLAEAERALAATDEMPEPIREARRTECQEWVESLTNEVERVLQDQKVVHIAAVKLGIQR